jgi:hypothetical protein
VFPWKPDFAVHPLALSFVAPTDNSRGDALEHSYKISQPAAVALADGYTPTRVFRTDAGLSVGLLAARTGLSIRRITDIEAGDPPRLKEMQALGRALTLPAHILADGE